MRWLRPIPEDWIPCHLMLFIALCVVGMTLRATEQLTEHARGDVIGFTNAMIDGTVAVILVAATASTVIVEGAMIFAEKYLKHRYERGLEQGIEQGLEQGIEQGIEQGLEQGLEQGREEGVDEERQRWKDWDERRKAAEAAGEPFNEPSPAETQLSR